MLGPYAHATHTFFKLGRGYIFERKRWGAGQKYVYYYIKKILMEEREEPEDFTKRKKSATIDNYVLRTAESIKNIVFRKDIDLANIKNKELLNWLETDIDNKGNSINEFAKGY